MERLTVAKETWYKKIYDVVREANKALFVEEIIEQLPQNFNEISVHVFLENLRKRGLIVKSKRRPRTTNGGNGHLWAINNTQLQLRSEEMKQLRRENPLNFSKARISKAVYCFLNSQDMGYTTGEIAKRVQINISSIATACGYLFAKGVISRSHFKIPSKDMPLGNVPGYVYGKNMQTVIKGIERFMPEAVKSALILVRISTRVWSGWKLEERVGISNENQNLWLKHRIGQLGLIKYKIINQVPYFWNPTISDDIVEAEIEDYIEKSRAWRVNITGLGRLFEEKAVYTFVKYLQAQGYKIRTTKDFPKNLPSWLNKKERDKYKREIIDKNNYKRTKWTNDVWRFNREPLDYIIYCRDPTIGDKRTFLISCKNNLSKKFGVNYFTSFIGCVKMGRTKNGLQIPDFLTATPVFICSDTYGKNIWKFNSDMKGQGGIVLTLKKMQKMVEDAGMNFPEEHKFQHLADKKKAYEIYSKNKSVLLGEKSVLDLMQEKGFEVNNET